jgi:hypothetical protein
MNGKTNGAAKSAVELHEWAKQVLLGYPNGRQLHGTPDDKIIHQCLEICGGKRERMAAILREMQHAGKTPLKSWAWFPAVMKQYHQRPI